MMEKHSQNDSLLLNQLIDEEHQLMLKVSTYMTLAEKTAAEEQTFQQTSSRLAQVRDKIAEISAKKQE